MQNDSANGKAPSGQRERSTPSHVTHIDDTVGAAALLQLGLDDSPDDFVVWLESFAK